MSALEFFLLVLAGVGAGLCSSIAGLASLVSYPALLAAGLSPLAANVTNTWGLLANAAGAAAGSTDQLRGQGRRLLAVAVWAGAGGAVGAGLLLLGNSSTFRGVVPWLVALGGVLLLARDGLRAGLERRRARGGGEVSDGGRVEGEVGDGGRVEGEVGDGGRVEGDGRGRAWVRHACVLAVGIYGGYFGAGAGIMLLAVLSLDAVEPLAVTNAVKNVGGAAANAVAALIFAADAPVHWLAALALGIGVLGGSWSGSRLMTVLPERPLRLGIAVAALGLALALGLGWVG